MLKASVVNLKLLFDLFSVIIIFQINYLLNKNIYIYSRIFKLILESSLLIDKLRVKILLLINKKIKKINQNVEIEIFTAIVVFKTREINNIKYELENNIM